MFKELFHCLGIIPLGYILRCGIAGLKVINICVALERELSPDFAQNCRQLGAERELGVREGVSRFTRAVEVLQGQSLKAVSPGRKAAASG